MKQHKPLLSQNFLMQMRSASMRRKFVIFSVLLFLIIFIGGSVAFTLNMGEVMRNNAAYELSKTLELERSKLVNQMNSEIALVRRLARSALLTAYFENPSDQKLRLMFDQEVENYQQIFGVQNIYWVRDSDKKFYLDGAYMYDVDPSVPDNYWYDMTMFKTQTYNFNINYNPDLKNTNLWINAPVFDQTGRPIAIIGSGTDLTAFINNIYQSYTDSAELYFFNEAGEITGARNASLAAEKQLISSELGAVGEVIRSRAAQLDTEKIQTLELDGLGIAAIGKAPALGWYVAAVQPLSLAVTLQTPVTILFLVMMLVVMVVIILFNVFVKELLEPFDEMVQIVNQIAVELDISLEQDEAGALGSLFAMAITDPLTGLYNRRFMEGRLNKIIKQASRTNSTLAVLMIDIDHFKEYNDTYGHSAGDKCLKAVAEVLRKHVRRGEDFAARYGGEEFIVVLPNTDEEGMQKVADHLLQGMLDRHIPHERSKAADCVTVSIGGACASAEFVHVGTDYIKSADKALYMSKANGRNRYTRGTFAPPHLGQ